MIVEDLSIYFDLNGFAETHTLNGTAGVVCVVGDKTTGRSEIDGTWIESVDVTVPANAITIPVKGQSFYIDSTRYSVDGVRNDGAVINIMLSRPVS